MSVVLEEIKNGVIKLKPAIVKEACERALAEGISAQTILNAGLIAGMAVVGEKFKNNQVFVPEVLMASKATHAGMDVLKPILAESAVEPVGKFVLGTVKDDLHDIGKNLVGMMLEGAGFEVIDLGMDVEPEKFVEAAREHNANIVGMSSLITSTLHYLGETIAAMEKAGLRDSVKIMVGGAPVTVEYANQIGADGYGKDASEAVEVALKLLQQ